MTTKRDKKLHLKRLIIAYQIKQGKKSANLYLEIAKLLLNKSNFINDIVIIIMIIALLFISTTSALLIIVNVYKTI